MKNFSTRTAFFFLATALAVGGTAFADSKDRSNTKNTPPATVKKEQPHNDPARRSNPNELRAKLFDAAGTVSAEAEYETKVTKTEFEGNVRVILPNSYGINDKVSAAAAQVTLTLTHAADASPYAECTLALRAFKQSSQGAVSASYRVSSTNQNGTVAEVPAGAACDDISSGSPVTAVPAVTAGDSVSVLVNGTQAAAGTIQ